MSVIQNNIDLVNATLTVKVSKEDYSEKYDKALKIARKKINVPGFRVGMAPMGMVKKMYGPTILVDEINKIVSEELYNYINENKLNILGEPLPNENSKVDAFNEGDDFEFVFDIALAPEFKVEWNGNLPYYNIDVDAALIEKQVDAYRGRFGKYVPAEKVEEKDVIKGELVELNADGSVKEGGVKVEKAILSPGYMKEEDQKAQALGKAVGEIFVFNPAKAFGNENEIASLLQIKKEEAKEFAADCQFTVAEITRFAHAELDQELFDAAFGKDAVKSADEFRAKVKAGLEEQFSGDSDIKLSIDVREYVLNQLKDVQFADEFLKRWLKATNKEMTESSIEAEYPKMIEDLKWQMAKDQLLKEAEIKVDRADIEAAARSAAKMQFIQYGMLNVPEDILDNYVTEMLKDKNGLRNASDQALNAKFIASVKERATFDNKTVSFEEFNKFFQ
jgi:trigger factor